MAYYEPLRGRHNLSDDYTYPVDQCDIPPERHPALQSYRDKRQKWLSWIDTDKDHAIWLTLSSMVWRDVSFRLISHLATNNQGNCLNNAVLGQIVIDGYVTMQVLAIRRLMDNSNSDVVSLRKL